MAAAAPLCDFEQARAARVARNNAVLAQLVSTDLRVPEAAAPAPRRRRVSEVREPAGPPRRSVRAEGKPAVNYSFAADDDGLPRVRRAVGPPRFTRKRLTLEELEAMTEEEKEAVRGPSARACATRGHLLVTPAESLSDAAKPRKTSSPSPAASTLAVAAACRCARLQKACRRLATLRCAAAKNCADRTPNPLRRAAAFTTLRSATRATGAARCAPPAARSFPRAARGRRRCRPLPLSPRRDSCACADAPAPQKTVEQKVTCTSKLCSVGRLPHSFCGACLQNRHGEDVAAAAAAGNWLCPRCRGALL